MAAAERVTRLDVLERLPLDTVVAEQCGIRWVRLTVAAWVNSAGVSHTSRDLFVNRRPLRVVERPPGLF